MALFKVTLEKHQELAERMRRLGVSEEDLEERFIRASGPGGQKVNKASTCVYLRHLPTGLWVKCARERYQSLNRFLARRQLLDRIERMQKGIISEEQQRIAKLRRQKRKRSKRAQEKILAEKHRQSEKKSLRGPVKIPPGDQ